MELDYYYGGSENGIIYEMQYGDLQHLSEIRCTGGYHVYSIDEVFMDVTDYLNTYRMTARELAGKIIREIQQETSIAATAGIGTNCTCVKLPWILWRSISEPDQNGVRIAELTEISYRKLLWAHQPITDFWRVGPGYAKKLAEVGLFTMGDVARCSLGKPGEYYNEDLLYRLFGVNAELLIDHAWGWGAMHDRRCEGSISPKITVWVRTGTACP